MPALPHGDVRAFYDATLTCLRYVEARTPTGRRFGPDADAQWAGFAGHLATADRIDLLLRDADAQWPGAFSARIAFDLPGVALDDALGPEWQPFDPVLGEELWRSALAKPAPSSVPEALAACGAAWGLGLTEVEIGPIDPNSRVLVAGPSAVAAVAKRFEGRSELSWADQVRIVAGTAGHRHLAALVAALLNTGHPTRFVEQGDRVAPGAFDLVIVSSDATPAERERTVATGRGEA
jgi:hypothetical protein